MNNFLENTKCIEISNFAIQKNKGSEPQSKKVKKNAENNEPLQVKLFAKKNLILLRIFNKGKFQRQLVQDSL